MRKELLEHLKEKGYDLDVFKNQIVYSTNSNFEFVYLNSMFVANP